MAFSGAADCARPGCRPSSRVPSGAGRWHSHGESARDETSAAISTRSTRVPAGRWAARGSIAGVDAPGLAPLLTPEGWALLEALPPYDADGAMALGERLRAQGAVPA